MTTTSAGTELTKDEVDLANLPEPSYTTGGGGACGASAPDSVGGPGSPYCSYCSECSYSIQKLTKDTTYVSNLSKMVCSSFEKTEREENDMIANIEDLELTTKTLTQEIDNLKADVKELLEQK